MFGKAKIEVSKTQDPDFQYLEKPTKRIPMLGKAKIHNSSAWNSQNSQFQCLE